MFTSILYNKNILPQYYKLGIAVKDFPAIEPGQFIMLKIAERIDPLLRRPFGVYNRKANGIEIVYKVVGKGTKFMTGLRPGDKVDVLGPLGKGFPTEAIGKEIIMVAGGIGIVPFYLLTKRLQRSSGSIKLLFGGRSNEDLPCKDELQKLSIDMKISTQDGSLGEKGLVTDLLEEELSKKSNHIVFACGPKGMLKKVVLIAKKADAPCFVSLDNVMACGIGACLGCAVKIGSGKWEKGSGQSKPTSQIYKMVCKDGPVFDAREIIWEKV